LGNVRKKLLVKYFAAPIWGLRLSQYGEVFTKRRAQFEFAMNMHTNMGVAKANVKLDAVIKHAENISEK
jgi:hypothetical protein